MGSECRLIRIDRIGRLQEYVVFGETFVCFIKECISIFRNIWNTGLPWSRESANHGTGFRSLLLDGLHLEWS